MQNGVSYETCLQTVRMCPVLLQALRLTLCNVKYIITNFQNHLRICFRVPYVFEGKWVYMRWDDTQLGSVSNRQKRYQFISGLNWQHSDSQLPAF